MRSIPSLLLGPLWLGVVAPDRVLSMGQIQLFDIMELWGMRSIPSLLLGPLWLGVVAPDRVLSMGQIQLFDI